MSSARRTRHVEATDRASTRAGSFEHLMGPSPDAIALTRGADHRVVYMNAAFGHLVRPRAGALGGCIADAFTVGPPTALLEILDRVFQSGIAECHRPVALASETVPRWMCTVWTSDGAQPNNARHLVVQMDGPTNAERLLNLQREVAARMLATSLNEQSRADEAEASSHRSAFLASEGRRLARSIDEDTTLAAIAATALPRIGAWCIVDVVQPNGDMKRLGMIHPDPEKQRLLRTLGETRWTPQPSDPFGLAAVLRGAQSITIPAREAESAIAASAHNPETLGVLHAVGLGPLLTVPLPIGGRVAGAITFVGAPGDDDFTDDDANLAEALAVRSAMALDNARAHGEIVALKLKAEAARDAKSAFLGTMSHELRTPLNAIGGYVELLEMGLRGPVTAEQRADLERIKQNQAHLLGLITDVLNFVRIGSDRVPYRIADVDVHEIVASAVGLVEPLIRSKGLTHRLACDSNTVARADAERVTQIVVNLLSNAIKFTPAGGRLLLECEAAGDSALIHIEDSGVGISSEMLDAIFDPFVQVRNNASTREGVGLGLAVSRGLARGMGGDLTATSTPGKGSRFTLRLPLSSPGHDSRAEVG